MCSPAFRSYADLGGPLSGENYIMVGAIAPVVSSVRQGTNLLAGWYGFSGFTYQLYCSTNLVDWLAYGGPIAGSNAPVSIPLPMNGAPQKFFRVGAIH